MGTSSTKLSSRAEKRVRYGEPIKEDVHLKKQKIDSKHRLQLVDINNDCLIDVFEYLSLEDLFNVAETHSSLVPAAQLVFARRYRKKEFFLNLDTVRFLSDDCIEVRKDIAAAFVRLFGTALSSLFINFDCHHEQDIEESLLDNCSNTLTKLELALCNTSNLNTIDEPFRKVINSQS